MALPPLVAADQLIRAVWGNAVVQALRNSMAGKATEAHQVFQSTGVEEAEAFDKPATGEAFLLHGQSGLSHLDLIPETKLASDVTDQLHSDTDLDTIVDAAVVAAVISWATTGNTGRLPRSKMSAQSAVVKATAAGQLFYATGDGQISALAKGANGTVLIPGDAPSWATPPAPVPTMRVYTSSGTWTKPAGLVYARVRVQGPGGASQLGYGGGGGYAESLILAADLDATESYVIGTSGNQAPIQNPLRVVGIPSSFKGLVAAGGDSVSDHIGGIAIGGDLNIPGADGWRGAGSGINRNSGGDSQLGYGGHGGNAVSRGFGAGWASTTGTVGPGVVIVEEFSLP